MHLKTSADRHLCSACGLSWPNESQLWSCSCICDISTLLCLSQYILLKGRAYLLSHNTVKHFWTIPGSFPCQPEEPTPTCINLVSISAKVFTCSKESGCQNVRHWSVLCCNFACLTSDWPGEPGLRAGLETALSRTWEVFYCGCCSHSCDSGRPNSLLNGE